MGVKLSEEKETPEVGAMSGSGFFFFFAKRKVLDFEKAQRGIRTEMG